MKEKLLQQVKDVQQVHQNTNSVVTFYDIDDQLKEVNTSGLLAYQAVVLKDNISTKGVLTTGCSGMLSEYVPVFDATIVTKLKEAGAIFLAKTTLDELAMGGSGNSHLHGPTFNPYHYDHQAGGSSGGSAAIAGSRVIDFAIGSDTGDSVRKPASYCGVVGFKPSYGRISRYGVIAYASSLDHVAYFTSNVDQSLTLLKVLAGYDVNDPTTIHEPLNRDVHLQGNLKGKRFGVLRNVIEAIDNPELILEFKQFIKNIEAQGATVVEVTMPQELMRALLPTYSIIANSEAVANHASLDGIRFGTRVEGSSLEETMIASRTAGFGPSVKKRFVVGAYSLADENQELVFNKAQRVRHKIVLEYDKLLNNLDAILTPATPSTAPRIDAKTKDPLSDEYLIAENHLVIGNFGGYPSITIPMMFQEGLPLGINITSAVGQDIEVLDLAKGIESMLDFESKLKEYHHDL